MIWVGMSDNTQLLEFQGATAEAPGDYAAGVWDADFLLPAGGLLLVRLERGRERLLLGDLCEGLRLPGHGSVRFLGEDWAGMSALHADAQRGRIGRVFEEGLWIGNLTVADNVTLAERHHTRRPLREIEDEAMGLARTFGLPGLPRRLPAELRAPDLGRAACVRAFLGDPLLVVLERPTRDLYPDVMAPLINTIQAARARGAAILWSTTDTRVWSDRGIRPTGRFRMAGSQLVAVSEDA